MAEVLVSAHATSNEPNSSPKSKPKKKKTAQDDESERERVLFIGTQFSILYTFMEACGLVHVQTFNNNLKELGVVESKRGAIRKGLVHELLYAQDTVL